MIKTQINGIFQLVNGAITKIDRIYLFEVIFNIDDDDILVTLANPSTSKGKRFLEVHSKRITNFTENAKDLDLMAFIFPKLSKAILWEEYWQNVQLKQRGFLLETNI